MAITIHRKIDLGHPFSPPCSPGIWPCHGLVCPVSAVYVGPAGGASARIWAFDLSWLMVREATAHRSAGRDLVLQADVHHIPCRAASFDHIICFAAFPHFDDPKRSLTELARVARPGADIIIAHLLSREELAHHHGSHKAVADDILPDPARMTALFIEAGFTAPHITDVPGRYLAVRKRW